jgi:hypothetical protein
MLITFKVFGPSLGWSKRISDPSEDFGDTMRLRSHVEAHSLYFNLYIRIFDFYLRSYAVIVLTGRELGET